MVKILGFWGLIVIGFVGYCNGYEYDEYLNGTEVLFQDSVYGVSAAAARNPLVVDLTIIQGAGAQGAVCLDGTLPGYHLHRGYGSGANSWLIQLESMASGRTVVIDTKDDGSSLVRLFQFAGEPDGSDICWILVNKGGGWCNTIRSCVYRKRTRRGSLNYMEKQLVFSGILSNKAKENPDFFNWNRVKLRYCDGASFAGDSENKAAGLQFRGQRIWWAAMQDLKAKGMRYANQALLSGCSAGGLASILKCDEFRGLFSSRTKVKCLSDGGLFLDVIDVAGRRTLRNMFGGIVNLQGVQKNLPPTCTNHLDPTSCFFPENLIAGIKTPLFLLNAAYDSWQVTASLAPSSADPHGYWSKCKMNNAQCSASQIKFLQRFRDHMVNVVNRFSRSPKNGLFLNSCFAHCQSERQDTWFSDNPPLISNKGIAHAVGDWYFDRAGCKAIDCAYPCDKTCHNLVFR